MQEPPSKNPALSQRFGGNCQILRIGVDGNGGTWFQKIDKDQCRWVKGKPASTTGTYSLGKQSKQNKDNHRRFPYPCFQFLRMIWYIFCNILRNFKINITPLGLHTPIFSTFTPSSFLSQAFWCIFNCFSRSRTVISLLTTGFLSETATRRSGFLIRKTKNEANSIHYLKLWYPEEL